MRTRHLHSLLALLGMVLLALPLRAQTITTRTLDFGSGPNGQTGQHTSQAVVNGNPAIAYYNVTEGNLMFARNSAADGSGTWTITTVDYAGTVGSSASLAVVNGNPAISYFDGTNGDLRYVRALDASGTSWGTSVTVDNAGNVGPHTSLVVVNGNPAISYYGVTNLDLKYVRASDVNGTIWGTPMIVDGATVSVGEYTSMKVVNGNPAITYFSFSNGDLKYVRALDANGGTWGAPVIVDSTGTVGGFTSLAVVNGNPAITYYDFTNLDLKYVRAADVTGAGWGIPVIVDGATSSVGQYTSLAVVNGNPAISYYDATNGDLKYVRAPNVNGTSWGAPLILDATGDVGLTTSLVNVNGSPAISYYDSTNGNLKYMRASDASGASWLAANTPDTGVQSGNLGQYSSQAIVNGNPAISYYDSSNGSLKYVRALDAGGTSWGTPVTLDTTGDVGFQTSLAVVNGNPAVSYRDAINFDLKYVRALDANGTSWGTPVTVASLGNVGSYPSLAVVNGNPAISYYDSTNGDLKYVRALNVSGTSWGTPVTVDSAGNVGLYTSLAVVNGNPAVSYFDTTNVDLKYVRALDAGGTNWGTPMTLDSAGFVGQYTSLAVVIGNPAISYYDNTNGDLKYVRALDASGTNWGTPVTLDSAGNVGFNNTSLVVVNGNPAISYYDQTNGNLKWATYVTPLPDIAVAQAGPVADGGSVDFGAVTLGSSSAAKTFTITNPGTADLTTLAITGGTGEFVVSSLSGTSVPVGSGSVTFTVTFTPAASGTRSAAIHIASNVAGTKNPFDIALSGTGQTIYQAWAAGYGVPADNNNLPAFAFGLAPGGGGSLVFNGTLSAGGTIGAYGLPITWLEPIANGVDFRMLYVRRKDYVAAGLTYVVEFSNASLGTWSGSLITPTVLADDGVNQIVSVPYPPFVGGKKARFSRVRVTLAP